MELAFFQSAVRIIANRAHPPAPFPEVRGANNLVLPHPYQLHKQFLFIKKNTLGILHTRDGD